MASSSGAGKERAESPDAPPGFPIPGMYRVVALPVLQPPAPGVSRMTGDMKRVVVEEAEARVRGMNRTNFVSERDYVYDLLRSLGGRRGAPLREVRSLEMRLDHMSRAHSRLDELDFALEFIEGVIEVAVSARGPDHSSVQKSCRVPSMRCLLFTISKIALEAAGPF